MASRPKSGGTGSRRTSSRSRKPATIDLKAKEVGADAEKPAEQAAAASKAAKTTGQAAKTSGAAKAADTSTAGKTATSDTAKPQAETAAAKTKQDAAKSSSVDQKEKTESKSKPTEADAKPADKQTEKPMPAPAPQKSGGGIFSGIVGAVLAVVGLGAVGQYDGAKDIPLIGSLYDGNSTQQTSSVSEADFAALQEKVSGLSASGSTGDVVDLGPVNEKIAALEASLKSLSEAGAEGGSVQEAAINSRIDAIETGLGDLKSELATLATSPANGEKQAPSGLEESLVALSNRLDAVEGDDDGEKLSTLEQQLTDLAGKVSAVETTAGQNAEGIDTLVSQSGELKDTVASVKASEKVAKSVAVNALATALDNDDPLTLPIASLEALIGELPETKRLAELGAAGIPSIKTLVSELDAFTSGVQNPGNLPDNASLSDKFWANAQNLVSFRSTGPRDGDDPLAILSRVRDNVKKNALPAAKAEWAKLPAEIQEQGNGWSQKLEARIEAYQLQSEISSKLALQAG